jgi:hypothetical protein
MPTTPVVGQENLEAGLQQASHVLEPVADVTGIAVAEQQRRQRLGTPKEPRVELYSRLRLYLLSSRWPSERT